MTTWGCTECSAVYSVGAPRCPECGSTSYEENLMPKITVHGGPSDASLPDDTAVDAVPEAEKPAETVDGDTATAPKGNASQGEWAEFAASNGYEGDPSGATRDELRTWWDEKNTTE